MHDDETDETDANDTEETPDDEPAPKKRRLAPVVIAKPSPWGSIPRNATHWALKRQALNGTWEKLMWAPPGAVCDAAEWPLHELSEAEVQRRWGAGTFQAQWIGALASGGRKYIATGAVFHVRPVEKAPEHPPAAQPAVPAHMQGFLEAMQIGEIIERRATTQLTQLAQMATLLAGANRGPDLAPILDNQRLQFEALLTRVQADADRRYDALRSEIAHATAARPTPTAPPIAQRAAAAAVDTASKALIKPGEPIGESLKASLANYVAENPGKAIGEVVEVIKGIPALFEAIAKANTPPARPRPIAARTVDVEAVPVQPPPLEPGLNGFSQDKAKAPATPASDAREMR